MSEENLTAWQCPNCKFVVDEIVFLSILIEPTCRCGESWSSFNRKKLFTNESAQSQKSVPTNQVALEGDRK